MSPPGRRILCLLALLGCLGAIAFAAPETKTEMNVQLPPFIVESTIGPTWRYTEIPRFEILSRCNDLTTERLALAFHRANQLLGLVLPDRFQLALDVPQALIFYDEKLWPVAEQQAVSLMLRSTPPTRPDGGLVAATPPRVRLEPITGAKRLGLNATDAAAPSSAFFSNLMLTDADAIVTFALVSETTIDPQRSYLTPAYVGNLLQNRAPALPEWFMAGFLRLYDRMDFEGNTVTVKPLRWDAVTGGGHPLFVQRGQPEITQGNRDEVADFLRTANSENNQRLKTRRALELGKQPLPVSQQGADQLHRDAPATKPKAPAPDPELLIPLAEFLGSTQPDGQFDTWLAQAELFVAWGLDPANDRAESFWNWIDRASTEPVTETLFQECLGLDFSAAAMSLIAYSVNHRGIRWVLPENLARPPPVPTEDATPRQIARIKGEWERLEARYVRKNQPDLEEHYVSLARKTLRKPYDRGDRDPRLLASLGLLELEAGDKKSAQDFLAAAVRAGVVRPRAYYALARLRYDHLFGRSTRNDGKYTAEQTDPILQPLLIAARQAPPLPAVYELMTHVCFNRVEPPPPEVLAALAQGVRLFSRNGDLVRQVAALHAGTGEPPRGSELRMELSPRPPRLESSR